MILITKYRRLSQSEPILVRQKVNKMGWSLGLVVIGGDLCSEGHGFKSQHHILDGDFSHIFCLFEKAKIKEKEARDGSF